MLLNASFAVTVTLDATPAVVEAEPVTARWVAAPGVKLTVAVLTIATPSSVPVIVAVPTEVADVSVAE